MEKSKHPISCLLISSLLDSKDELDEKLERSHQVLLSLIGSAHEREANDILHNYVSKGPAAHEDVAMGLLYTILTDPKSAKKTFTDMTMVVCDGMAVILSRTSQLIHEKWIKLLDTPRSQMLWLTRELVKSAVPGSETLCLALMRQVAGGDVSSKNIWLSETLLGILSDNRAWLDKCPNVLATSVYTYLRIIADHGNPMFNGLRQKEVDFCISILREKWAECMGIGRDLVRLLQNVARIPEFEKLWKDILHNPAALHTSFTGVQQLMLSRTSRRLIASRLTPDMENKLNFLTNKVKFGHQKRYQDWFQRQYLCTPESQSLRCDLIRYICTVIHPSNEILGSDVIPRWAVIGWLLTTCTSNIDASYAKLSLFYDWLFFDPEKESIMNIEPCILVMYHSMKSHPVVTATLLDFMCRIMTNFYPPLSDQIKKGMHSALKFILDKRVLQSLSPLFDNPKLDRELRSMIREKFAEFCSQEVKEEPPPGHTDPPVDHLEVIGTTSSSSILTNNTDSHLNDIAEFSDEDDEHNNMHVGDSVTTERDLEETRFRPIREAPRRKLEPVTVIDITEHINQLEDQIKQLVIEFQNTRDNLSYQCEIMDRLIQTLIQERCDQETTTPLAVCLSQLMSPQFQVSPLPPDLDEESIEDSIGAPLYVLFRNLCQTPEEDPSRNLILLMMEEIYHHQPKIAYHLLYFLKVSKVHDEKLIAYKDFCNSLQSKDLGSCLLADLTLCQEDDVKLFTFLVPDVFTQFSNVMIGNVDMLHLIVSSIDGSQLQDLICQILQGHLVMFNDQSLMAILNASLEWETIEQYFLWKLFSAHDVTVEQVVPILPKLEFAAHAEALTNILVLLKQEFPTTELLRLVLCRERRKYDVFTVSIIKHWAQEHEDKLAELICTQLTRNTNTPSRKRQRQGNMSAKCKDKDCPTTEQILGHLEHMRQTCKNITFITHELMQQGLQHVQTNCSEQLKAKFGDLLALAEDFEETRSTRVLRRVPSRRASEAASKTNNIMGGTNNLSAKAKKANDDISSESDSSEVSDGVYGDPAVPVIEQRWTYL